MSHYNLDARRLLCPLPVIRVQERVKQLKVGDTLEVVCTDKGSLSDISAWCRVHGHHLVSSHRQQREIFMTIQVCSQQWDFQQGAAKMKQPECIHDT